MFYVTADILARSLANFHCQYEFIIHEFKIYVIRQQARANNLTICYRKKTKIDTSFSCVCSVVDHEFRQ